jgi:hypothetical protein
VTNLIGKVDAALLLQELAGRRPVFHSEADFQHALAWELHRIEPTVDVRLEIQVEDKKYLDLLFRDRTTGLHTAVEVKYPTALWSGEQAGESFALRNHGAQDIQGYHIVNDVARLERFCGGKPGWNGVFILLTNEPSYWRAPTHGRTTNAEAFRVYDGVTLNGRRGWGPRTGPSTMRGLEAPIDLQGSYLLRWGDYSTLEGTRGTFRSLIVDVAG